MSELEVADDDACQMIEKPGDNKEVDDGGLFKKKTRKKIFKTTLLNTKNNFHEKA